jgi:hypothetical protein
MPRSKTVIATYETLPEANVAIAQLYVDGFTQDQISMIVSDTTKKHLAFEHHTKAPEGAVGGAAIGGAVGAVAAGLTAVAGISIPGVGVLLVGPLLAALMGLGAGGAAGGLIGGLVGLGFSETEAKVVEDAVQKGNVVIALTDDDPDRVKLARKIFDSTAAIEVAAA